MASRGDIEAGRAFVRIWVNNKDVGPQLDAVGKQVVELGEQIKGVGAATMQVGAAITTAGLSIIAGLSAAVMQFAEMGSQLDDISKRTGIAAGALAEYKFAAEQSGTSLEAVEKSAKKMQQTVVDAIGGSESAMQKLAAAGVSLSELQGLSQGDQLALIGKRIADIADPAMRTAAALDIFGKSGSELLPMFSELDELSAKANKLGLVPTEQAVADAAKIGDLMDSITATVMAGVFEIGAAMAPVVIPILEKFEELAGMAVNWIRENDGVIQSIAAIGAALVGVGGIVTTIGGALFSLGALMASLGTIAAGVAAAFAIIASPIFLIGAAIAAAIAGAIGLWLAFTDGGKKAAAFIGKLFSFGKSGSNEFDRELANTMREDANNRLAASRAELNDRIGLGKQQQKEDSTDYKKLENSFEAALARAKERSELESKINLVPGDVGYMPGGILEEKKKQLELAKLPDPKTFGSFSGTVLKFGIAPPSQNDPANKLNVKLGQFAAEVKDIKKEAVAFMMNLTKQMGLIPTAPAIGFQVSRNMVMSQ